MWGVEVGHSTFVGCAAANCKIGFNPASADAILFRNLIVGLENNFKRPTDQIWIYYTLESPRNTYFSYVLTDAINWTATYRRDSDIVAPYAKLVLNNDSIGSINASKNFAEGRTKKVAWFVSNCATGNRRLDYAKQLPYPVD